MVVEAPPSLSPAEIRAIRTRFGRAKDFASLIGITPEHLSRLEHGTKPPSRTMLRLLAILQQQIRMARCHLAQPVGDPAGRTLSQAQSDGGEDA